VYPSLADAWRARTSRRLNVIIIRRMMNLRAFETIRYEKTRIERHERRIYYHVFHTRTVFPYGRLITRSKAHLVN
jgi:hypothetical protein